MTKQDFKEFCHNDFTKRGFIKKKSIYFLKGKDLLCGLYLQKSMGNAFYVEHDFFLDKYDNNHYPTIYESDVSQRFAVLSKDTYKGEHFMDAMIEYERYTEEELQPYFDNIFEEHIMPAIILGKEFILDDIDYYDNLTETEKNELKNKILGTG